MCRRAPFTIPTVTETILGRHEEWMLGQKVVRPKDDPKLRPKDQPDSYRFNPRLPKFGVVIKTHKRGRPTLPGTIWHSEHHAIIDLDHEGAYSHDNSFREFMARHIQ
jgi:hypothetical protein